METTEILQHRKCLIPPMYILFLALKLFHDNKWQIYEEVLALCISSKFDLPIHFSSSFRNKKFANCSYKILLLSVPMCLPRAAENYKLCRHSCLSPVYETKTLRWMIWHCVKIPSYIFLYEVKPDKVCVYTCAHKHRDTKSYCYWETLFSSGYIAPHIM